MSSSNEPLELSEQYIFLGIQQGVFFFQHLVKEELNVDMSGQIIHLLIHENRITDQNSVIIYEINSPTEKVDIVYIRHVNGESKSFNKENLVDQYKRLITSPREYSFVISTDGENFIGREIPLSFICDDIEIYLRFSNYLKKDGKVWFEYNIIKNNSN